MIDGQNVFDKAVKNDLRTYDNMRKVATGQEYDCTSGCLLDCPYFKEYYKMIAIDLSLILIQKQYNKHLLDI